LYSSHTGAIIGLKNESETWRNLGNKQVAIGGSPEKYHSIK
jgi:hypothetical protein